MVRVALLARRPAVDAIGVMDPSLSFPKIHNLHFGNPMQLLSRAGVFFADLWYSPE